MLKLSVADIIGKIVAGELFECESTDEHFSLKIEAYSPVVCTAIHAGHQLRPKLQDLCELSEEERLFNESPFIDQLIQAMPITLIAKDSRYEYDLNHPLSSCIYTKAWGMNVWSKKPSQKDRDKSIEKHKSFYAVLDAINSKLESLFGASIIFDVQSYNHTTLDEPSPTFNLGTEQINMGKWCGIVHYCQKKLNTLEIPNIPINAELNAVFYGRGYLISHINSRFLNTLVLPLDVKKIFMDELKGELYPLLMNELSQKIKHCLVEVSALFTRKFTSKNLLNKSKVLADKIDPSITLVDRELYQLARGFETLHYINPINIAAEKKRFLKNHGKCHPDFRYKQLDVDPYLLKEKLYRLPVSSIRDPGIQFLYRSVVESLSERIDMLVQIGKPQFLYESLKYYGEPSLLDEKNAHFLLHASEFEEKQEALLDEQTLINTFKTTAKNWGMACKVELSSKIVASAMVSNSRKAVMIAKGVSLHETEANALLHHELGVHMATTLNAHQQTLKVFTLGLPGNTLTQEGLAILNEYQSGHLTLKRLKGLALRVLAVKEMLKVGDFKHTYNFLNEEHRLDQDQAFKLALRVHRAGGLTKDYLYLNGVSQALSLIKEKNIKNLYVGKTGFEFLPIIDEMVERQLVKEPQYVPSFLTCPQKPAPTLEYLINCIHYGAGNENQGKSTIVA